MLKLPASCTSRLNALIANATRDPLHDLPRVSIQVCSSLSPCLYSGSAGVKSLSDPTLSSLPSNQITSESVFDLFSCTKLVTVIAALQLIEEGKLSFEEDAGNWLEELRGVRVLRAEGLDQEPSRIRVKDLMIHTAGYVFYSFSPTFQRANFRR